MIMSLLSFRAFFVFLLPAAVLFAAAPAAEVHQKCLQHSREVYRSRVQDCRGYSRVAVRCRAEAEKEKREILDYCAAGAKKPAPTIIVTSH